MGRGVLEQHADVADFLLDGLEVDVLLVGDEGRLLAHHFLAPPHVLLPHPRAALEDGPARGELLVVDVLDEVVEVVVAERDEVGLGVALLLQEAVAGVLVGLDVDLADDVGLAFETGWGGRYIFWRVSWRLTISSTFCLTLSNRNWYCSFSMRDTGSFPKISCTVSNSPISRIRLYVLFTISSTSSSLFEKFSRLSYFIIHKQDKIHVITTPFGYFGGEGGVILSQWRGFSSL